MKPSATATVETTAFPIDLDTDVDPRDDETDTDFIPVIDAMLSASSSEDVAFASPSGEAPTKILTLRSLKAVDAVPVGASDEWIEIDAAGRGKSKSCWGRAAFVLGGGLWACGWGIGGSTFHGGWRCLC